MQNRTKVLLFLAITGWLRVLFVVVPIGLVYFGINDSTEEYRGDSVTSDTQLMKK